MAGDPLPANGGSSLIRLQRVEEKVDKAAELAATADSAARDAHRATTDLRDALIGSPLVTRKGEIGGVIGSLVAKIDEIKSSAAANSSRRLSRWQLILGISSIVVVGLLGAAGLILQVANH